MIKQRLTQIKGYGLAHVIILVFTFWFLVSSIGCEAFVRKFSRKPKKEKTAQEELVLVPEEYKGPQMTKEERYRQYFLFWKSWHDELITSLIGSLNHKKQMSCVEETIKNVVTLRTLLKPAKQKKLDIYINKLNDLKDEISRDLYGSNMARNRQTAEQIKRNILRDFSYNKVEYYLI